MHPPPSKYSPQQPSELVQALAELSQAQRLLIVAEQLGLNTASLRSSIDQLLAAVALNTPSVRDPRQLTVFGIAV